VLIVHDPDGSRRNGFTHWLPYDIPASTVRVRENVPTEGQLSGNGLQGRNDSDDIGYTGPCPPSGRHRYFARLYALREKLNLRPGASAAEVQTALDGKVIEQTELLGTYEKDQSGRAQQAR